jgi:hypothetical protein
MRSGASTCRRPAPACVTRPPAAPAVLLTFQGLQWYLQWYLQGLQWFPRCSWVCGSLCLLQLRPIGGHVRSRAGVAGWGSGSIHPAVPLL